MEERSMHAEDGEGVGEPPGPTRAGAPPAGGALASRPPPHQGRRGRERERKVREKRSQRQVREGGREEEGRRCHRSPLAPGVVGPVRVGRKSERERRDGERSGKNLQGEAGAVVYIWFSGF